MDGSFEDLVMFVTVIIDIFKPLWCRIIFYQLLHSFNFKSTPLRDTLSYVKIIIVSHNFPLTLN